LDTQEERKSFSIKNNIIDFLQSIVIAIAICVVVYIVFATPNQIEGESMEPNFFNNEIVLTSKVHQWLGASDFGKSIGVDYHRGDVIVFQKPNFSDFIKRVIGMPGDKIQIENGKVFINGTQLVENYLPSTEITPGGSFLKDGGDALTVPADSYFVMGDNRENSHDSRYSDIGFVKREWMKGKVLIRYWPLSSFKIIN